MPTRQRPAAQEPWSRCPDSFTLARATTSFAPTKIYGGYIETVTYFILTALGINSDQVRLHYRVSIIFLYEGGRLVIFVTLYRIAENDISDRLCSEISWWITTRPHISGILCIPLCPTKNTSRVANADSS